MTFLEMEGVGFKYGDRPVLRDISLSVAKGGFFGLLGPNGSGKSTLLSLIAGMHRPDEGQIRLKGVSPQTLRRRELARLVAVVPQSASWAFPLTVEEVVLMGRTPHLGRLAFESPRDLAVIRSALEKTDLLSLSSRRIDRLSGGERQRVLIAKALAQEPELLLLDEPTSSFDIAYQVRLFDLIRSLCRQEGLTVLAVTHDINLASLYCTGVALLREGEIRGSGPPRKVLTESLIEEVYGVRVAVDHHSLTGLPRVLLLGSHPTEQGSR